MHTNGPLGHDGAMLWKRDSNIPQKKWFFVESSKIVHFLFFRIEKWSTKQWKSGKHGEICTTRKS